MIKELNKPVKKLNTWDLGLIKWATAAAVLFIIAIWPAAMNWVQSVNPWYFLIAFVIFAARPAYRYWIK